MDHRLNALTRTIGLLLTCLLIGYAAAAQPHLGTLSGTVQDSLSRQPVAFATVVLLPIASNAPALASAITNEQGIFTCSDLALGTFRLQVSFVGYSTHMQAVTIGATLATLPPIRLAPAAQQLGEAVVIGAKPLVDVRSDRLVYNAAQDIGNAGGTAQDVLRKTPLLAVDGAGNVTLRGTANFKVLVNNHPSPTLAQNLAQALKGIPADQILSVEVVTTPSAKDDGEGTAGIINIVLKKEARRNLSGRLGASGGNRARELTSALGVKKGKFGVNAAASAGQWYEPDQLTRRRLGFTSVGTDTLTQSGRRQNTGTWYNSTLSVDYDPATYHSFSLLGTLGGYQARGQRDLFNRLVSPDATLNQLYTRATTENTGSFNTELTGTYTRTFALARRQWSVLGQYARNVGTFGYDADQYTNSAVALTPAQANYRERSRGRTPSHEVTAQTYANVAATTFYQLTLYGSAKPAPKWEVSGGPNVQYVVLLSPEMDLARRGLTAGLSVDTSYQFAHKITAQASLSGALPTPVLQGQGGANLYYQVGVKKAVLGQKADLALNLTNPFNNSFPNRNTITTAFLDEQTEYRTYQQALRLSFNYRFGQNAPEREHKRVSDDDLKSK